MEEQGLTKKEYRKLLRRQRARAKRGGDELPWESVPVDMGTMQAAEEAGMFSLEVIDGAAAAPRHCAKHPHNSGLAARAPQGVSTRPSLREVRGSDPAQRATRPLRACLAAHPGLRPNTP